MAAAIPYLDETWSPVTGCGDDMVSPGCQNCYARRMFGRNLWKCPSCSGTGRVHILGVYNHPTDDPCPRCHGTGHQDFTTTFHADRLEQPLHWRKPRRIGVSFMGDWAHPSFSDSQIMNIFGVMAAAPQHEYLLLTKRPERQKHLLQLALDTSVRFRDGTIHTWAGVTICTQAEADRNIPILLDTPAAKRWVSLEPMLGAVDLSQPWIDYLEGWTVEPEHTPYCSPADGCASGCPVAVQVQTHKLDWVVLGGETGAGARRMHAGWAVDVWKQCRAAGVPFYWKQAGSAWLAGDGTDDPDDAEMLATREMPAVTP